MECKCSCKTLVDGTPQLAISQGVQVSLFEQQEDGSFALLETASANNYDAGQPGGQITWRSDDQLLTTQGVTRTSLTMLGRDPLKEHYFQGVQDPDLAGIPSVLSQGQYIISPTGGGTRGPKTPQFANSPAGWTNPGHVVTGLPPFASTDGASGESLIATGYGDWDLPTFPPTITVTDVGLTITVSVDISRDVFDDGVFLTLDGVTPVGTDQSHPYNLLSGDGTWCPLGSAFQENRGYGSFNTGAGTTQNLWGLSSLTVDQINAPTFGVIFLMKSNSGLGQGYIQSWTMTISFTTAAGLVYEVVKSSTYALGPCNKGNITSNVGPVGMQDTSRLRPGATVQVMNPSRTAKDNWYYSWSGVGPLAPPPSHQRPTTKTSPGVLCEWQDPTIIAYMPQATGILSGWSGDDFALAPLNPIGVSTTTFNGPLPYTFDGATFTAGTMDTLTLPSSNPSGWTLAGFFAADSIHGALTLNAQYLYLCQRSGSHLGSISQFTFTGVDIGDINHTIATAAPDVFDISPDGSLLAFRATNGGSLPERVHVYSSGGSVLAVLVPASINFDEHIKQINFSDDGKALVIATTNGLVSPAHGRTSVWTTTDGGAGVGWTETWQRAFQSDGAAFSHGYRVPA